MHSGWITNGKRLSLSLIRKVSVSCGISQSLVRSGRSAIVMMWRSIRILAIQSEPGNRSGEILTVSEF
jgi:hypothetical protein